MKGKLKEVFLHNILRSKILTVCVTSALQYEIEQFSNRSDYVTCVFDKKDN